MNFPHLTRRAAAALLAVVPFLAACSDEETPQAPVVPVVSPGAPFLENDQLLFRCDFQDAAYAKTQFHQSNLARLTPNSAMRSLHFSADSAWIYNLKDDATSINSFAGAASGFAEPGAADAWLVSRPIDLPAGCACTLSWLSESLSLSQPDGLKVFVSTTGGDPEKDFPGEPVWQTDLELAGETELIDGEWNAHDVSLGAYAGKRIWIAFVNQTEGGQLLCLDDVAVQAATPFYLNSTMPKMSDAESVTVEGYVTARNAPLSGYTVHYTCADSVVRSKTYTGLNLQPGETHAFRFDEPLRISDSRGVYVGYRIWADVGATECIGVADSVGSVAFVPQHKVVIEEGTGSWCGWCPLGILAFEHLQATYPDHFIGIAVHNDDPLMVADYDEGLQCPAFPLGAINRELWGEPMKNVGNEYFLDAAGTWRYYLEQALATSPTFEVRIGDVSLSEDAVQAEARLRFAFARKNPRFRVAYVLTEDDVQADFLQINYLAQYRLEAFGKFGAGGEYGQQRVENLVYQDVARCIWPAFRGKAIDLPATVQAGSSYPLAETIDLQGVSIGHRENLSLTVLIINDEDGTILAADRKKL